MISSPGRTLIESHHNVTSYQSLDVHYPLWGKEVLASIDVATEGDALLRHFPSIGE